MASAVVALYMKLYGFNARDAFAVVDALETSLALTPPSMLYLPLLLPMLLSRLRNSKELVQPVKESTWKLVAHTRFGERQNTIHPHVFATQPWDLAQLDQETLMERVNKQSDTFIHNVMSSLTFRGQTTPNRLDRPMDYARLLNVVGQFKGVEGAS